MAETKKRKFDSQAAGTAQVRLVPQASGQAAPQSAGVRAKTPGQDPQQQELIYRLIEFLKTI